MSSCFLVQVDLVSAALAVLGSSFFGVFMEQRSLYRGESKTWIDSIFYAQIGAHDFRIIFIILYQSLDFIFRFEYKFEVSCSQNK